MSNFATPAPTRKAGKAKPKATPTASQQLSTGAVQAALTELADILCAASLGTPRDDCTRLLDCASNAAERPLHLDGFDESDLVEIGVDAARDIIALVRAAGHFPEALAAGNRGHLIAQAEPLIEQLTGKARPFSNSRQAPDSLGDHSSKQAQLAFAEIATQANTMLTMVRNSGGDAEQAVAVARVGFQMIGSIADHMCGLDVVGTPADWAIGDSFCEAGKAVHA